MSRVVRLLVVLILVLASLGASVFAVGAQTNDQRQNYIVMFDTSVYDPELLARMLARLNDLNLGFVYEHAIKGFSAEMTPMVAAVIAQHPNVTAVQTDQVMKLDQENPTGIQRIGVLNNALASVDGTDNPLNIDVAVIDSGIDSSHPDLNVAGGYNCTSSNRSAWQDGNGHGTHVAGTIAARDNDIGVVGVAPGARLWSVKVFGDDGTGAVSWFICGVDWIVANSSTIEVANFSGSWSGGDTANCGNNRYWFLADTAHQAICRLVNNAGIPLVVAASNEGADASNTRPATYAETIAVGAIVDTDGAPGGLGPSSSYGADDTRASFSNYGSKVSIYAPGVNILSTVPGGGLATANGTSMASPHVAGAAALYLLQNPNATPNQVRQALVNSGESGSWASQPLVRVGDPTPPEPIHDVQVTSIDAPMNALTGNQVAVQVNVRNAGNQPESISVSLDENGSGVGTPQTIQLAAGASQAVSFNWTPATTGSRTLTGTASISTGDANTADNSKSASVQVRDPLHDVAVTSVSAPANVTVGQAASVDVVVVNNGDFAESVAVSLTSSPANAAGDPATQNISLDPGQSRTVTFNWTTTNATTAGPYTLISSVAIASDNQTGNNSGTASITVLEAPLVQDLYVQDVSLSIGRGWFWFDVNGSVTIRSANGPVSGARVTVRFIGPRTNTTSIITTNSSGVATFSTTTMIRGTYTLTVEAVTADGYSYNSTLNVESSASTRI